MNRPSLIFLFLMFCGPAHAVQVQFNSQFGDSTYIKGLSVDSGSAENSPWSAQASYTASGAFDHRQSTTVTANTRWWTPSWNTGGGFEYGDNPDASTSHLGPNFSLGRSFAISTSGAGEDEFTRTFDVSLSYQFLRYSKQPLKVPGATVNPPALSANLDQTILGVQATLYFWSFLSGSIGYSNYLYNDNVERVASNFGAISSFGRGTAFSQISGLPSSVWNFDLNSSFAPTWNVDLSFFLSKSAITGEKSTGLRATVSKYFESNWNVSVGGEQDTNSDSKFLSGLFSISRSF